MLELAATYEDGKLTPLDDIELPKGKQRVIVTFVEEQEDDFELSDEWKAEIIRRSENIKKDKNSLTDMGEFLNKIEASIN